ncbi:unnamed protein product, partial [Ceratitis capitata]
RKNKAFALPWREIQQVTSQISENSNVWHAVANLAAAVEQNMLKLLVFRVIISHEPLFRLFKVQFFKT